MDSAWLDVGTANDKRRKKMQKKASKGDVTNFSLYKECVLLGIVDKPELHMVPDKTRVHANHDLNVSEVRELLLSIYSDGDHPVPKYFSIKNKGFLRNVLLLHISDCTDPVTTLNALGPKSPSTIRISREDLELSSFPEKLLTVSANEGSYLKEQMEKKRYKINKSLENSNNYINDNNNGNNDHNNNNNNNMSNNDNHIKVEKVYCMDDCLLSDSSLGLWGYPVPVPVPSSRPVCSTSFSTISPVNLNLSTSPVSSPLHSVSVETNYVPTTLPTSLPLLPGNPDQVHTEKRGHDHDVEVEVEVGENGSEISHKKKKVRIEEKEEEKEKEKEEEKESEINEEERGSIEIERENDRTGTGSNEIMKIDRDSNEKDNSSESDNNKVNNDNSNNDNSNNSSNNNNCAGGDDKLYMVEHEQIGVITGTVPTHTETLKIFSQMHPTQTLHPESFGNPPTNKGTDIDTNKGTDIDTNKGTDIDTNKGTDIDTDMKLQLKLKLKSDLKSSRNFLFPTLAVTVQTTKGGAGVLELSGYRSTVSPSSDTFQLLWPLQSQRLKPQSVVAVDCEMCDTVNGLELTRLTVVDQSHTVLLDTLVKPKLPITNYRTQWSGITADSLNGVTVTLEDAQLALLRIVSRETFLIGHSLDSDLKALKICHTKCLDSSILYPHPRGFPFRLKLKELAETHLNIIIQRNNFNYVIKSSVSIVGEMEDIENKNKNVNKNVNENVHTNEDEESNNNINKIDNSAKMKTISTTISTPRKLGHDSIEDASTAMRLVYLKIQKGPDYGTKSGPNSSCSRTSLAQFFIGTGINSGIQLRNANESENEIKNKTNRGDLKNSSSLNYSEHSADASLGMSPETSFFWESLVESRSMRACLTNNSVFHPFGPKDELLIKFHDYFCDKNYDNNINIDVKENSENSEILNISDSAGYNESNNNKKKLDKINEKTRIENALRKQKFSYFGIKYSNECRELEIKNIIEKLKSSLESSSPGSLLIVTAQCSLSSVTNLLKQKKACDSIQSVSRWSPSLDFQLRESYSKCNKAAMITITL